MLNVADEFNAITEHFSPRVIAMANGQYFKLAKFKGEFPFHSHADEDEFFLVHRGTFTKCYRDREVEAWVMFVEPAATRHTGDAVTDFTRSIEQQIAHLGS